MKNKPSSLIREALEMLSFCPTEEDKINFLATALDTCIEQVIKKHRRDYFAGQALAGSMASAESNGFVNGIQAEKFAEEAYLLADAMLAEREKGE